MLPISKAMQVGEGTPHRQYQKKRIIRLVMAEDALGV